ncbi:hypothetical protein N8368_04050 [Bacteroidia bacterium]|nr:hypothetical protein [Bacteroidia bacterium]MDB9883296.1 hypothetical protein [Bacteroidia bacterium]MDC1395662.1 hypothetical protein [Bacteroidia bacterium]
MSDLFFRTTQKETNDTANLEDTPEAKQPSLPHSEFSDGLWLSEEDSNSRIEIKNGKWTMLYEGTELDSNSMYY